MPRLIDLLCVAAFATALCFAFYAIGVGALRARRWFVGRLALRTIKRLMREPDVAAHLAAVDRAMSKPKLSRDSIEAAPAAMSEPRRAPNGWPANESDGLGP